MISPMFIAHGSPMVAIEDSEYGKFLDKLGKTLPRPKAIVIFSAHWESKILTVSEVEQYSMIYDFAGFPPELYQVVYPAQGHPALAKQIQQRLQSAGIPYVVDEKRGLDHGVWTILHRLYPHADIPIVALSVQPNQSPQALFAVGRQLEALAKENILVIGSGVTVHNFQILPYRDRPEIKKAVYSFENWLEETLQAWDLEKLFAYENIAPYAEVAVPSMAREHFVPLFYVMGAAGEKVKVETLHRSWLFEVMSNTVFAFHPIH